ncbi:conserved hypothetical protein [Vibrio parahaemolyticus Peru-466]|nr:conserved hypothetical protein [Vibrio parahaemolyticus Peru-466]ETS21450.1 hypothetical protein D033_2869 [Vibrio parahaemolyticus B-265]ETT10706.1 hypothetical protein D026_2429 [Vibrio parahaemolyticus 605]EUC23487.1 hypothetical protein D027_3054 [Vibrio parahaemolyticus 861]EWM35870.1 hypothetical protein D043_3948 [Vibrio parahaemolyticus EKP-021]EXJ31295.1 hypothetical protein D031_3690 [Vibrio parahaemolyticus VP-48]
MVGEMDLRILPFFAVSLETRNFTELLYIFKQDSSKSFSKLSRS